MPPFEGAAVEMAETQMNLTRISIDRNVSSPFSSQTGSPTSIQAEESLVALTHEKVNLVQLASAALGSSIAASRPIRKLAIDQAGQHGFPHVLGKGNQKNARVKMDGTVVTDADGAAQRIIIRALVQVSRKIRIVGEESRGEMASAREREIMEAAALCRERRKSGFVGNPAAEIHTNEQEQEMGDLIRKAKEEIDIRLALRKSGSTGRPKIGADVRCSEDQQMPSNTEASTMRCALDSKNRSSRDPLDDIEVDSSRVSVFIDPLDGTSSYAEGKHECVSILVGIIVDNIPIFGVVCMPFGLGGSIDPVTDSSFWHAGCHAVYGGSLIGGAFVVGGDEIDRSRSHRSRNARQTFHVPEHTQRSPVGRAVISKSRAGGVVGQCVDALADRGLLHREPIHVSGAGVKGLRLITGTEKETLWFFPKPGTSLWDVAALDALLRVVGGRLTDKDGKDLDYSKSRKDADNLNGIVASNDVGLHDECIRWFKAGEWHD